MRPSLSLFPLGLTAALLAGSAAAQSFDTGELPDLATLLTANTACSTSAALETRACRLTAGAEYLNTLGACLNLVSSAEALVCAEEAAVVLEEIEAECAGHEQGRIAICGRLGEAPFDPELDAADFIDPAEIGASVEPNPYLPLVAGTRWTYRGTFVDDEGDEVVEEILVTVTTHLKLVDGITAVVVNDVVTRDGFVHEDTNDWFAQDREGNVWYLGEEVRNYAVFEGDRPMLPELIDTEGAWRAGENGARAGIAMWAEPAVGLVYRQEFGVGGPQDVAEITDLAATEVSAAAACDTTCLVIREWTPVEPGIEAFKVYAPGIGMILELEGDARIELVAFEGPTSD